MQIRGCHAVDLLFLFGSDGYCDDGPVEVIFHVVVRREALPHAMYGLDLKDGVVPFLREDMTGVFGRPETQDAVRRDLQRDVAAMDAAEPFAFFVLIPSGRIGAIDKEHADRILRGGDRGGLRAKAEKGS